MIQGSNFDTVRATQKRCGEKPHARLGSRPISPKARIAYSYRCQRRVITPTNIATNPAPRKVQGFSIIQTEPTCKRGSALGLSTSSRAVTPAWLCTLIRKLVHPPCISTALAGPRTTLNTALRVDVHHGQAVRVQDVLDTPRRRRAQGLILEGAKANATCVRRCANKDAACDPSTRCHLPRDAS